MSKYKGDRYKGDVIISLALLLIVAFLGLIAGWSLRIWSTADKAKRAAAARDINDAYFHECYTAFLKSEYLSGRGK